MEQIKKKGRHDLTAERLRELLCYDPDTGMFSWRVNRRSLARAGKIAGCIDKSTGYWRLRIMNRLYHGHRVAFLYMTGEWPRNEVDHINGCRHDNSWSNLRDVSSRVNKENFRRPRIDNQCGKLGVCFFKPAKRWKAEIQVDKERIHLGYRRTKEEAAELYLEAKRRLHEGCTI